MQRYKYCFVPSCTNTTMTAPQKLYISLPSKEPQRSLWIKALRSDTKPLSPKSKFFVCEDHFDIENEVENLFYARMFTAKNKNITIRLKPGVIPTRFILPSCVPKQKTRRPRRDTLEEGGLFFAETKERHCLPRELIDQDAGSLNNLTDPVPCDSKASDTVFPRDDFLTSPLSTMIGEEIEMTRSPRRDTLEEGCLFVADTKERHCLTREFIEQDAASLNNFNDPIPSSSKAVDTVFSGKDSFTSPLSPIIRKEIGIQAQPFCRDVGIQARAPYRSAAVQVATKTSSVSTSPFQHEVTRKKPKLSFSHEKAKPECDFTYSEISDLFSDADVMAAPGSLSITTTLSGITVAEIQLHKEKCCSKTLTNIERRPKLYLGVTPECFFVIGMLAESTSSPVRDIMMTLKKLRCNHQFGILADDFGISASNASKIFQKTLPKLTTQLRQFVYWPTRERVFLKLPMPFRKHFSRVAAIIDCMEIQVEKPNNSYKQAMTWSSYYGCNTFKYLVSCTPNGFINFISKGYGGRITDVELVNQCGFINKICPGDQVMADRGFKNLSGVLNDLKASLVRPPSASVGAKLSRSDVSLGRKIASLRVHIERVIGRIREFKYLLPHTAVDRKLVPDLDLAVTCVAGLINIQSIIL